MPVKKGKLKTADEAKIRINYDYIINQVDANDLVEGLYVKEVLEKDDIEEIENQPSGKKRTRKMLDFLLNCGPGDAFDKFMTQLRMAHEHVALKLEATVPEVQQGSLKAADEWKIRSNYEYIIDEVDAKDLVEGLYIKEVLDKDDIEEIENQPSRKKRTKKMLDFLLNLLNCGPGDAFDKFMTELRVAHEHVALKLEATVPEVQQDSSWEWFDNLPDDFKSRTVLDGDFSRIASLIATKWEIVVLRLGLTMVNIEQEKAKHPWDPNLVLTNLLIKWRYSRGRAATLQCLVDTLREVDCGLDMEGLRKVILNMSSSPSGGRPLVTSV